MREAHKTLSYSVVGVFMAVLAGIILWFLIPALDERFASKPPQGDPETRLIERLDKLTGVLEADGSSQRGNTRAEIESLKEQLAKLRVESERKGKTVVTNRLGTTSTTPPPDDNSPAPEPKREQGKDAGAEAARHSDVLERGVFSRQPTDAAGSSTSSPVDSELALKKRMAKTPGGVPNPKIPRLNRAASERLFSDSAEFNQPATSLGPQGATSSQDFARIISVSPPATTALHVGTPTRIAVVIRYALYSVDSAMLVLYARKLPATGQGCDKSTTIHIEGGQYVHLSKFDREADVQVSWEPGADFDAGFLGLGMTLWNVSGYFPTPPMIRQFGIGPCYRVVGGTP